MTISLIEIEQHAAQLAPNERAKLAEFLLESLQNPVDAEIKRVWDEEISQRVSAYENQESVTFSAEVVFAEARRSSQ
jgi:putative addiction module component (TIGR02574 family)